MAALLSGCSQALSPSGPPLPLPVLQAAPISGLCGQGERQVPCTILRTDDWQAVVRAMKTYCLALGGTREACAADP